MPHYILMFDPKNHNILSLSPYYLILYNYIRLHLQTSSPRGQPFWPEYIIWRLNLQSSRIPSNFSMHFRLLILGSQVFSNMRPLHEAKSSLSCLGFPSLHTCVIILQSVKYLYYYNY